MMIRIVLWSSMALVEFLLVRYALATGASSIEVLTSIGAAIIMVFLVTMAVDIVLGSYRNGV